VLMGAKTLGPGFSSQVGAVRHDPHMAVAPAPRQLDLALLDSVQQRVLALTTAIVHHANRVRPSPSGVKVGGHQASRAGIVSPDSLTAQARSEPERSAASECN